MLKFYEKFTIQPQSDNGGGGGGGNPEMYAKAVDTCTITVTDEVIIGTGE